MSIDGSEAPQDEAVVLPPVPLDPVFTEAVEDALAGAQVPTSKLDPNRVLGADPHDFAGLYLRHRSAFAAHARRFLRDPRDVDEVVQESFLRLFLALPELTNELQALAYCRRTITNLCIDRYRADQRRPRLVDLESVPADVLTEDQPDDPVIQAEDAAIVREALALLSPLHREALVKREIEEKPLPQIAEELGVPEESVKHLLHRARRALRRKLADAHRARGLDVDDMSTLSLLARSAVAGSGRVGVLVLLFLGLVVGLTSTTKVPAQAFDTISGLWGGGEPEAPSEPSQVAGPAPDRSATSLQAPPGLVGAERDAPGPVFAPPDPVAPKVPSGGVPAVAAVPGPVPVTGTADTRPTPSASASTRPSPSAAPTVLTPPVQEPTAVPTVGEVDPRPEPTGTPSSPASRPTPSASPQATSAPVQASQEQAHGAPVRVPVALLVAD